MQPLDKLASCVLDSVTGGKQQPPRRVAPSHNRTTVNTNLGVAARGVRVGIQADVDVQRTDYAHCLDTVAPHATPAQIRQTCGLPGGS